MEANIMVVGFSREKDVPENERRISSAVAAFRRQYPGAITREPIAKPIDERSQMIAFAVKGLDLGACQGMQAYFERQLLQAGFTPTDDEQDSIDCIADLAGRVAAHRPSAASASATPQPITKPWWKLW